VSAVLLDTGPIVALIDRSEQYHRECATIIRELKQPLVTCEAVIAEACYLVRVSQRAIAAVLENVESGLFHIPFQLGASAAGVRNSMRKYRDLPMGLADACLVQLADELDTGDILTLDRHFQVYRWRNSRPFRLLVKLT